jgi:hypothetical protein
MADEATRSRVHQLNNLFQVIIGSLELLKRSGAAPAEVVNTALRSAQEASVLAQELLASSTAAPSDTGRPKK